MRTSNDKSPRVVPWGTPALICFNPSIDVLLKLTASRFSV